MPHQLDSIRHDILTAIEEIQGFISGRSLQELLTDRAFQLVLEREFEILGEALYRIRNISPEAFDRIPAGHRMIGLRNILAHGYDRVDYSILWAAATQELELLRENVESMPRVP
jgi:uncharacterized protein with HEPN domain